MRTIKSTFFESKVRHEAVAENGTPCKLTELFTIDAMTFSECEAKVTAFVQGFTTGEFDILTECRAQYAEIFLSDNEEDEKYYKVKAAFITVDEKSGKPKKNKVVFLVEGKDIDTAKRNFDKAMADTMADYVVEVVSETAIQDIV